MTRLARAADRHRGPRAGRAGGARLPGVGLADDGPAHAGVRAGAGRVRRHAARGDGLERHGGAAPGLPGGGHRPGRRGDRAGVHVRGERRRAALRGRRRRCCATCAARCDFNLDPADVARRITPRTRAVVAVHFCGYPADVAALRALCDEHGLVLIEDCAQAIGARVDDAGRQVGTVGELGAFSFFSKKQLCVGEGGMVDERRRAAGRARAPAALARDDQQHVGPPPRPRPRLRRRRHRLQLPPRRAARGARPEPPAAPAGEHRRAAARWCAPTASASRTCPASSCRSTSRRSSAPRTSPSRCCSPTATPATASATTSKRPASRPPGIRRCTRSPSTALRPGGRPAAGHRGGRPPLRAAAQLDDGRERSGARGRGRARGARLAVAPRLPLRQEPYNS